MPENLRPQTILIVKLSAIGDVVQTLPMAEALRRQFPEAQIDWLVEEEASDLLLGHPVLNRVLVSRRKYWLKQLRQKGQRRLALQEIIKFLRTLRSIKYDWVIDNHGLFKSGLMVFLSRGKRKIGFQPSTGIADEGNYLFTNERYKPLSIEKHALERYLDLVHQLGVNVNKPVLKFPVSDEIRQGAKSKLSQRGLSLGNLVVIHPLAKWPTKQWPKEKFARLADNLINLGATVVFTGSLEDHKEIKEICGLMEHNTQNLNLAGQTGLRELAALFSLANLVITTDTGPMHLAAAVQAPLIVLFGPTAPWRTGPYGNGHEIIRRNLPCSPCFKKTCSAVRCMEGITVEEVFAAAIKKLKIQNFNT
ncbi:MAG: lipopolysaccharide heptosyltransferase II [Thermodesulfobacteriota bacterium]